MASPLQFAYRTQKAIGIFDAAPVYEPLAGFSKPEGNLRCCAYSQCGRFFAWASPDSVTVVNALTGHQVLSLPIANVYELDFSPLGTFVITWERPAKDEAGDATKNLKIWRTTEEGVAGADKQPLGRFVQKQQGGWNLQYTADEKYCARLVSNEVQFFESHDLITVWNKLRVEGAANFALAPGSQNHAVAVFVPERKGQPAAVKVYNVPMFQQPISQKTFFKGDKAQLKWNKRGSSILVLAQTDVDKSGKSYYGETTLYLLSTNGAFDARVTLDKEGPIHDVSWSPNSREFGVVYGYMPAKATIFNDRAAVKHSFPLAPRNTVIFAPNGRFVLVAGFGNLAGQIDVYDSDKDYRKICTIESGNPSVCEWSADSRYIMTATTSPRLRVDNGVKLWHIGGTLMYNEDMVELYHVVWRPAAAETTASEDPLKTVPTPHESATAYLGTVKTPSKPAGAYRPPGARGLATPLHFKREDEGGAAHQVSNGTSNIGPNGFGRTRRAVPGAEPADSSAPARKAKKKRNKKVHQEGRMEAEPNGGASLAPPAHERGAGSGGEGRSPDRRGSVNGNGRDYQRNRPKHNGSNRNDAQYGVRANTGAYGGATPPQEPTVAEAAQSPGAKKIRGLQKKIRAIEDLEMRLAGGEKLEDTQLKKMNTKGAVLKELEALEGE
ncbi:eukaryotic translation initiation factor eIF2A domain-containing protein [Hirsutella rhossiliensis]|uniref:Eukaryotic translation initiation factor 2A n=1 Tax=Hirsutella rhossiliensis TaxID=111463 RepID=A0A9P8MN12_9HYPO|nr:eukaryotic translation initiation factor eIF2A domain-containing protein [Hirsutella rhossiliensis]KAH0958014.1 eukaryotic translation initiation factor eIF2A domain-containing protein [Hirsutella rhossiliensis]